MKSALLSVALILVFRFLPVEAAQTVSLAWDASADATVTGYKLYYGEVGGSTTNSVDVGNVLTAAAPGLLETRTYFFYVTAYNASRIESVPSNLITYTIPGTNTQPTISAIPSQTVNEDISAAAIAFTVGDAETAAGSLILTKGSSNTALVPTNNIVFGGSGASRTVTVTPVSNQSGTATITVTVSDGQASTSTSFVLTVNAVNDLPTISSIANQTINPNTSAGPISFTVGDVETAPASLTLTKSSSNTTLVPANNIAFGGSGASRTVTVTPAANQSGTANITVTVSDGAGSSSTSFVVTVIPNSPPTISSIPNQTVNEDTATGALAFSIGDAETAAASLTLSKGSSNTGLVPVSNIILGGTGASRTVAVTPAANQTGTATVSLTVSDGTSSTTTNFVVTVVPINDPPTITFIPDQTISGDSTTGPIAFAIGDSETSASSLTLTKASSSTDLVPLNNIVLGGSGASQTVTVTPVAGLTGSASITLTVSDGTSSASSAFLLTVTPALPALVYAPVEAELATLAGPMVALSNVDASQRVFIRSTVANDGTATFAVNLARSDTYVIWCRVYAPDSDTDSFFVSADGGPEMYFAAAQGIWSETWQWVLANDADAAAYPKTFNFSAGSHTIVFRGRGDYTGLDQILVTNDRSFLPDVDFTTLAANTAMMPAKINPNGSMGLTWQSTPGSLYRVRYKTRLSDPLWTIIKPDVLATGTTTTLSDYIVGNRFYSVTELGQ